MKLNNNIKTYGNPDFRGKCPTESAEQITFFNWLRREYPDVAIVATHIRNEGRRSHAQTARQKAEGMRSGQADIIIAGAPTFVCELKRADRTQSKWQDDQQEYLIQAASMGAFACVALGHKAAIEAFKEWNTIRKQ